MTSSTCIIIWEHWSMINSTFPYIITAWIIEDELEFLLIILPLLIIQKWSIFYFFKRLPYYSLISLSIGRSKTVTLWLYSTLYFQSLSLFKMTSICLLPEIDVIYLILFDLKDVLVLLMLTSPYLFSLSELTEYGLSILRGTFLKPFWDRHDLYTALIFGDYEKLLIYS